MTLDFIEDVRLRPVAEKVLAGTRLSFEDGLALERSSDLLAIGCLANRVREQRHGNACYFNVNRHINPTNICVSECKLCAFGKKKGAPGAYAMSLEEAWQAAASGYSEAVTEFHIVGGLHPELPLDWYLDLIRGLRQRFPKVHLKAFTIVEIAWLAQRAGLPIRETLLKLKEAGAGSLPGGGAEIFNPIVRRVICAHKMSGEEWLAAARAAHQIGLHSNATMLYGHLETAANRVDHLLRLRELQDETRGFLAFIPLAFHPANTQFASLSPTTGFADLKSIAIGRLMLDNFPHIKAYWVMMTPAIAQVALHFGADDLDGTVAGEKIYHDAGATTSRELKRDDLLRLIRAAGRNPVERDTLHQPVSRPEATLTVQV
jgi:aminodeoxyfutalosine synthase